MVSKDNDPISVFASKLSDELREEFSLLLTNHVLIMDRLMKSSVTMSKDFDTMCLENEKLVTKLTDSYQLTMTFHESISELLFFVALLVSYVMVLSVWAFGPMINIHITNGILIAVILYKVTIKKKGFKESLKAFKQFLMFK